MTDLPAAIELYTWLTGGPPRHREVVAQDGLEAVFFDFGGGQIELLAAAGSDSPVGRFLARRGPGLHHLAYRVDDVGAELERWRGRGAELIDQRPRPGSEGRLVAFVHPHSAGGVLIELCSPRPS